MAAQAVGLLRHFPSGQTSFNRLGVNWRGIISPSDYSREYTVELDYTLADKPRVWVREPDLKPLTEGRCLPHVYNQKTQELCLYLPNCGFWRRELSVASTILPWTYLWLYDFELWLVTNVWYCRGVHPEVNRTAAVRDKTAVIL
jgi:hypothetical protein